MSVLDHVVVDPPPEGCTCSARVGFGVGRVHVVGSPECALTRPPRANPVDELGAVRLALASAGLSHLSPSAGVRELLGQREQARRFAVAFEQGDCIELGIGADWDERTRRYWTEGHGAALLRWAPPDGLQARIEVQQHLEASSHRRQLLDAALDLLRRMRDEWTAEMAPARGYVAEVERFLDDPPAWDGRLRP